MSQDTNATKQRPSVGFIDIALLVCAWFFIELLLFRGPTQGHSKAQQLVQAAEPAEVAEAAEAPSSKKQLSRTKMFSHSDLDTVEHQMNFWLKKEHVVISNVDLSCSSIATTAVVTCPPEKTVGSYSQIKMFAGDADTVEDQMNAWLKRHGIKDDKVALTTTDTRHICIIAYTVTDE